MPKRKTDPVFAKAAKLRGFDRVRFLACGDLDSDTEWLVEAVKTAMYAKANHRAVNPYFGRDADERRDALVEHYDRQLAEAHALLSEAIVRNNAEAFRALADVLEQHRTNAEKTVAHPIGKWVARNPSHQLATDIAIWAWQMELRTPNRQPSSTPLIEHLLEIEPHRSVYRRRPYSELESFKKRVRWTAKEIGIVLAKEKPGPRK